MINKDIFATKEMYRNYMPNSSSMVKNSRERISSGENLNFTTNRYSNLSLDVVQSHTNSNSVSISRNPQKKENDMSVVGFTLAKDYCIAFCDGKSTVFNGYIPCEQLNRKNIQKFWHNGSFLCLSHGTNEFPFRDSNGNISLVRLEDWIPKKISSMSCPEELTDALFHELRMHSMCPSVDREHPICFLFVKKQGEKYFTQDATVSTYGCHSEKWEEQIGGIRVAGNKWYQDYLLSTDFGKNIQECSETEIENILNQAEAEYDRQMNGQYNPVGGKKTVEKIILS